MTQAPGEAREDLAQQAGAEVGAIMAALETSLIALLPPLLLKVLAGGLPSLLTARLRRAGAAIVGIRVRQAQHAAAAHEAAITASALDTLAGVLPDGARPRIVPLALPAGGQWQPVVDSLTDAGLNALRDVEDQFRAAAAEAASHLTGIGSAVKDLSGPERAKRSLSALAATQRMMDDLATRGITVFTDRAGRNWSLGAYSEMAIRTAASRMHLSQQLALMAPAGLDLVYADGPSSEMSCPHCGPFEGHVLSLSGTTPAGSLVAAADSNGVRQQTTVLASLGAARAAGFLHPNCRHSLMPFTDGAIIALAGGQRGFARHGTAYQRGVIPDDESASYRAQQRQRALERRVRAWKMRQAAAMSPAATKRARAGTTAAAHALASHVAAHQLTR